MDLKSYLRESARLIEAAANYCPEERVGEAVTLLTQAAQTRRPILICGNGGSASDAMHITGELVGRFLKERSAINAICLSSNPAVLTAWSNDYDYDSVFSRQVEAHGQSHGVIVGLSTSGNSRNVVQAFEAARRIGMSTIALTGEGGGLLRKHSDVLLDVPSKSTPLIQQVHICLYHFICEKVEAECFPG